MTDRFIDLRRVLAERPVVSINVLIGSIGAIGQSVLLAKALVDYPFKILEYPPSEFFVWVGRLACLVSATSAIASVYVLRSTRAYLIAAIPVVLCPIYFWLVYNGFFFGSGYGYARSVDTESDLVATELMGYEFGYQAISLSASGLLVGLAIGGITFLLLKRHTSANPSKEAKRAIAAEAQPSDSSASARAPR